MSFFATEETALNHTTLKCTHENHEVDDELKDDCSTLGGILSNCNYVWVTHGPNLEVMCAKKGNKVGAWMFGGVLKDSTTKIVCVEKINRPHRNLPLLVVAVDCALSGGMICIFNIASSKVIRAIQLEDKVTSLHVIDSGSDISTIPGPLRSFDGIMSIGTAGGDVFLLDLCLQVCEEDMRNLSSNKIRDELNPSKIVLLKPCEVTNIEHFKTKCIRKGRHLAIHLNVVLDNSTEHFVLKGQKNEDRLHVNKEEVAVSALYFCPQLASLLVGYNFGAFQSWNLLSLELVYTSPVCEDHIPVTQFTVQEPADDPRAFCYIWVSYSSEVLYQKGFPYAVMYSFCFNSKEYVEDYGLIYQDFQSSSIRFQMELGLDDRVTQTEVQGGICTRLCSVNRGVVNTDSAISMNDNNEDVLALCVAVWTVWCSQYESYTYVSVFDLNQWYKEQMPKTPNWEECSNYMLRVCVSDFVSTNIGSGPILDAYLQKKTLSQFVGSQRLEEHFYPTSLIFDLCCLREGCVSFIHNQGVQKALLSQIQSAGPLCLIEPDDIYRQIINLGLVPLFVDVPINAVSLDFQRELVLNVALEQQLMSWLCKCASEWANGSFTSVGCSIDLLLSWAFRRLIELKKQCDQFCVPLFDYSEVKLDSNMNKLLNNSTRQIKNLSCLYRFIIKKLPMFLMNLDLVEEQCSLVNCVCMYFEVLQWMLNMGLLPEYPLNTYPRSDEKDKIALPYDAEQLSNYFLKRRVAFSQFNGQSFSDKRSILFIDNLLEQEAGGQTLQMEWKKDGGTGMYPPLSLQALLRTYLIDKISMDHKHIITTYLLLDVVDMNKDSYQPIIPQLIKFPTIFGLSLSIIKITEAFWELDHGRCLNAIEQLLDPLVMAKDFKTWHHKVAIKSLIFQEQQNLALLYLQVRKPPVIEEEDVLVTISLYVANQMLNEAFYFEQRYRKSSNEVKLLTHLYEECHKYRKMHELIRRTLSPREEEILLQFLSKNSDNFKELKICFHLLRSQYLEAFAEHDNTDKKKANQLGLVGQRNASTIDFVLDCFKSHLPQVTHNLMTVCQKAKTGMWKEVRRPTPMSVFVNNCEDKISYKSTLIQAALTKSKRTFSDSMCEAILQKNLVSEETPFLRTPTAVPSLKRKSPTVIASKIINIDSSNEDAESPANKKLKLSPSSAHSSTFSKLDTPIIRRKSLKEFRTSSFGTDMNNYTPQSILKVRDISRDRDSLLGNGSYIEEEIKQNTAPNASDKNISSFGMSPRISRTPHSIVRFKELQNSSSIINESSQSNNTINSSKAINISSNEVSAESNVSDVFYSPNTSIQDYSEKQTKKASPELHDQEEDNITESRNFDEDLIIRRHRDVRTPDRDIITHPVASPRSRRSYKNETKNLTKLSFDDISLVNMTKTTELNQSTQSYINRLLEDTPENQPSSETYTLQKTKCTTETETISSETPVRRRRDVRTPDQDIRSPVASPRSRKSYKKISEESPVRYSPRFKRDKSDEDKTLHDDTNKYNLEVTVPILTESIRNETITVQEKSVPESILPISQPNSEPSSPNTRSKSQSIAKDSEVEENASPKSSKRVQPRKSLSRQVLENNARNFISSPFALIANRDVTPLSKTVSVEFTRTKIESTVSTVETSESSEKVISKTTVECTDTYTRDPDFKHEHIEIALAESKKLSDFTNENLKENNQTVTEENMSNESSMNESINVAKPLLDDVSLVDVNKTPELNRTAQACLRYIDRLLEDTPVQSSSENSILQASPKTVTENPNITTEAPTIETNENIANEACTNESINRTRLSVDETSATVTNKTPELNQSAHAYLNYIDKLLEDTPKVESSSGNNILQDNLSCAKKTLFVTEIPDRSEELESVEPLGENIAENTNIDMPSTSYANLEIENNTFGTEQSINEPVEVYEQMEVDIYEDLSDNSEAKNDEQCDENYINTSDPEMNVFESVNDLNNDGGGRDLNSGIYDEEPVSLDNTLERNIFEEDLSSPEPAMTIFDNAFIGENSNGSSSFSHSSKSKTSSKMSNPELRKQIPITKPQEVIEISSDSDSSSTSSLTEDDFTDNSSSSGKQKGTSAQFQITEERNLTDEKQENNSDATENEEKEIRKQDDSSSNSEPRMNTEVVEVDVHNISKDHDKIEFQVEEVLPENTDQTNVENVQGEESKVLSDVDKPEVIEETRKELVLQSPDDMKPEEIVAVQEPEKETVLSEDVIQKHNKVTEEKETRKKKKTKEPKDTVRAILKDFLESTNVNSSVKISSGSEDESDDQAQTQFEPLPTQTCAIDLNISLCQEADSVKKTTLSSDSSFEFQDEVVSLVENKEILNTVKKMKRKRKAKKVVKTILKDFLDESQAVTTGASEVDSSDDMEELKITADDVKDRRISLFPHETSFRKTTLFNKELSCSSDSSEDMLVQAARRTRSSSVRSSNSASQSLPRKRSTRLSVSKEDKSKSSSVFEESQTTGKKSTPVEKPLRKRSLRSASIDCEHIPENEEKPSPKARSTTKAASVCNLPVISEGNKKGKGKEVKGIASADEYSTSRRLTRRQAEMLQKNIKERPSGVVVLPPDEEMDPLQLLDKATFEGKPDPEELKVYEKSPTTSVDTGSVTAGRRTRRTASIVSEVSSVGVSEGSIRSRLRSADEQVEKDQITPPKRTRKTSQSSVKSTASSDKETGRKLRSRAGSTPSVKSNNSASTKKSARTQKTVTTRGDLPKIEEERNEEASGKSSRGKRKGSK